MRKYPREVNQLIKDVEQLTSLWAPPSTNHTLAFAGASNQLLLRHQGFDDTNLVVLQQGLHLAIDRRERRELNLDELLPTNDVNDEAPNFLLNLTFVSGIHSLHALV
jgi:hypothetical protein